MSTISCQKNYTMVVTEPNPGGYPSGPLQVDSTTLAYLNYYATTLGEGLKFTGVLQRIDGSPYSNPVYTETLSGDIPTGGGNGPGDGIRVSLSGGNFLVTIHWNYFEFASAQGKSVSPSSPTGSYTYVSGTNLAFFPNPAAPVVIS